MEVFPLILRRADFEIQDFISGAGLTFSKIIEPLLSTTIYEWRGTSKMLIEHLSDIFITQALCSIGADINLSMRMVEFWFDMILKKEWSKVYLKLLLI